MAYFLNPLADLAVESFFHPLADLAASLNLVVESFKFNLFLNPLADLAEASVSEP